MKSLSAEDKEEYAIPAALKLRNGSAKTGYMVGVSQKLKSFETALEQLKVLCSTEGTNKISDTAIYNAGAQVSARVEMINVNTYADVVNMDAIARVVLCRAI
jgi:flagellar capping protein FliD